MVERYLSATVKNIGSVAQFLTLDHLNSIFLSVADPAASSCANDCIVTSAQRPSNGAGTPTVWWWDLGHRKDKGVKN
jgi:hypothetical protein